MAVLGGWWLGGSVLASKTSPTKVNSIGLLKYDLVNNTITVSCFGSPLLRIRVLQALQQVLEANYKGIEKKDVVLICEVSEHHQKSITLLIPYQSNTRRSTTQARPNACSTSAKLLTMRSVGSCYASGAGGSIMWERSACGSISM